VPPYDVSNLPVPEPVEVGCAWKCAVAKKSPVTYEFPFRSTLTARPTSAPLPPKLKALLQSGGEFPYTGRFSRMPPTRHSIPNARRKEVQPTSKRCLAISTPIFLLFVSVLWDARNADGFDNT
jgi:hypothetical protein